MTHLSSAPVKASEEPEPVSLRFRFDSETVEQFAERYASDVSRGGIFVHSRQPFAVGTQLRLDLQLLDGTPLIVGEGTVFWTREPDPNKPSTVPGMGIRFSKLSGRSQQVIELVLSQRTGRERSGLFPTATPAVSADETRVQPANPKSKLPFNVFPGRPNNTGSMPAAKVNDEREMLANAGREEATPLVGVSAATLADARPRKDEAASSRTPPPAPVPTAEAGNAQSGGSGVHKRPPLSLIKPGAAGGKEGDKSASETSGLHRKLTPAGKRAASGSHAIPPPVTSTQEVQLTASSSGSTPPAPVQGEPALGASQSGVPRPIEASGPIVASRPSPVTPVPSLRPPMQKKLILGGAALLAVGLSIFLIARPSPTTVAPEVKPVVRSTASTSTAEPSRAAAPALAAAPATTGGEPAANTVADNGGGSALEPEAAAAASGKSSSSSSRGNDRRSAKGKPVPAAHRAPEPTPAHTTPPSEKPAVVEAPRAEIPAPTPPPAPAPAPVVVARAEPPAAPKAISTMPPPVAAIAHKLRMTSIPSEAEVELDGKVIGKTPLFGVEIDVSRPHALVVRKDGFAPFKQTISNSSEWSVRPSENSATLRIQALLKK